MTNALTLFKIYAPAVSPINHWACSELRRAWAERGHSLHGLRTPPTGVVPRPSIGLVSEGAFIFGLIKRSVSVQSNYSDVGNVRVTGNETGLNKKGLMHSMNGLYIDCNKGQSYVFDNSFKDTKAKTITF